MFGELQHEVGDRLDDGLERRVRRDQVPVGRGPDERVAVVPDREHVGVVLEVLGLFVTELGRVHFGIGPGAAHLGREHTSAGEGVPACRRVDALLQPAHQLAHDWARGEVSVMLLPTGAVGGSVAGAGGEDVGLAHK